MKVSRGFALATLMTLAANSVFAFNLSDAANVVSGAAGGNQNVAPTPQTTDLLSTLGTLNVTPEQAVGGTGALLGLAKNKLSGNDYSQLTKSVPGLDQLSGAGALGSLGSLGGLMGNSGGSAVTGALGNVKSMADVNSAFGALGMDSSMVGQFAPLILQYLGQQGASGSALQSLGSLWNVGS
ncbi:DUF2780 domain-containing protein [Pseudomonas sp. MH9.2]|uniref:DUF2780 domain-containing protein n=1 Tax=unclassified Pseudomonas TaxID=196821 RepID=UPI002AC96E61|nr:MULTISPECIES: DUF2780 domain-containing protein [unclassified Pseudomonas]MEB0008396.1 DUF2780 domain-containing protein [Pseudomonas sp. RTB2]MEB0016228.1 DUF2780 domain-containing protein [Pseudomonas sp. RTB3]MEB0025841.1 DUF2780 domain-containing protein [Pseudomonas sp. MH9.2]MEB0268612.1 DUF2780 domain-containing protein [Pseudomonas sp. 5B4]MEE3506919.1 DUF2780 domain-containing protein [Pseudomonas sp. 10C3]